MKAYLYLAMFGVMWMVSQFLLITKFNMGWDDILLLACFGGGCAGTIGFSMVIGDRKRDKVEQRLKHIKSKYGES